MKTSPPHPAPADRAQTSGTDGALQVIRRCAACENRQTVLEAKPGFQQRMNVARAYERYEEAKAIREEWRALKEILPCTRL